MRIRRNAALQCEHSPVVNTCREAFELFQNVGLPSQIGPCSYKDGMHFLNDLKKHSTPVANLFFLFLSLIAAAIFQRAIKWISSLKTEFSPIYYPRLCQRRLWWHFQIHINVEFHSVEGPSVPVRAKQERRNRKCLHAAVRLQLRLSGAACLWAPKFQALVSSISCATGGPPRQDHAHGKCAKHGKSKEPSIGWISGLPLNSCSG